MVSKTRSQYLKHENKDDDSDIEIEDTPETTKKSGNTNTSCLNNKNFISISLSDLSKRPAIYTFPTPYDNIIRTSLMNFDQFEVYKNLGNLTAMTECDHEKLVWTPPKEESEIHKNNSVYSIKSDASQDSNSSESDIRDKQMLERLLKNLNIPNSTAAKRISLINQLFK
ncbi:hypothetical protein SNEBB_001701 [Seison nebaliae]|nr:hypothetical protein SNEBB_001701 [Seison nebaliae]